MQLLKLFKELLWEIFWPVRKVLMSAGVFYRFWRKRLRQQDRDEPSWRSTGMMMNSDSFISFELDQMENIREVCSAVTEVENNSGKRKVDPSFWNPFLVWLLFAVVELNLNHKLCLFGLKFVKFVTTCTPEAESINVPSSDGFVIFLKVVSLWPVPARCRGPSPVQRGGWKLPPEEQQRRSGLLRSVRQVGPAERTNRFLGRVFDQTRTGLERTNR